MKTRKLRACLNCRAQCRPKDRRPDGRYACRPCREDPFRLFPVEVRAAIAFEQRMAARAAEAPAEAEATDA